MRNYAHLSLMIIITTFLCFIPLGASKPCIMSIFWSFSGLVHIFPHDSFLFLFYLKIKTFFVFSSRTLILMNSIQFLIKPPILLILFSYLLFLPVCFFGSHVSPNNVPYDTASFESPDDKLTFSSKSVSFVMLYFEWKTKQMQIRKSIKFHGYNPQACHCSS